MIFLQASVTNSWCMVNRGHTVGVLGKYIYTINQLMVFTPRRPNISDQVVK